MSDHAEAAAREIVAPFRSRISGVDHDNLVFLIAAAIRSAAPQWQPIESAPKDGETEVLAYIPLPTLSLPDNHRVIPLIWDDKTQVWRISLHPFTKFAPTHWMPLPASPPRPA